MVSCKKLSFCVGDDVCNCSCLSILVDLYVKIYTLCLFCTLLSLGSSSFSLVMGYSVCDQCQVGTSVSIASLLSDVTMGVSF